jgi:prefoldin alpha subunit
MEQQEYMMRINMLGQEAENLEKQMQIIDQQVNEFNSIKQSLEALKVKDKDNNSNGKEILANLGKGIFIKAKIESSNGEDKKLYVNVGKDVIVCKSIGETLNIIDDQLSKLIRHREELIEHISQLQEDMREILMDMQKQSGKGIEKEE